MRAPEILRPLLSGLLDALLPPRCLKCGTPIAATGALCADCWQGLVFLSPPCCAICGLAFDFDRGPTALCGECLVQPPPYRRLRAVFRYDAASRDLILAFKHADRTEAAPVFAQWLERAGAEILVECEAILPIPLHRSRLFARRYNQAALLASALAGRSGKIFLPDSLIRRRATDRQGHKGRLARQRNVAGAIALNPIRGKEIAGRALLLIDDVVTTGATIREASQALMAGGARSVDVLALARVPSPGNA